MKNVTKSFKGMRLLTFAFVAGAGMFAANAVVLFRDLSLLKEHERWVDHSYRVLSELDFVVNGMTEAETSVRGFVLTGDETFLEPARAARRMAADHLIVLKQITADNPAQNERARRLGAEVDAVSKRFDELVQARRSSGLSAGVEEVQTGKGRRLMEAAMATVAQTRSEEQRLLALRSVQADDAQESVDRTFVIETSAMLCFLALAYYLIRRHLLLAEAERTRLARESWVKAGLAGLNEICRGNHTVGSLCQRVLTYLTDYVNAPVGAFYTTEGGRLNLAASVARKDDASMPTSFRLGQGVVGEAAVRGRVTTLTQVDAGHLVVKSALGESPVRQVIVIPVIFERAVQGVIELGTLDRFSEDAARLFDYAGESLGVSIDAAVSRQRTQELLEETQRQAEELQTQQEELKTNNEELEAQAMALKETQERLQEQQEELRQTNEELQEQAQTLEIQKDRLESNNESLLAARTELQLKAGEIERASQYKSEFLANMSHELRTPLNSLLILATLLYENEEGNLSPKQIEFAKTIHRSGSDLLALISDILDLSKVEAGKLTLHVEDFDLERVKETVERTFRAQAEQKGLAFGVRLSPNLPHLIRSDPLRLEQIVKNFVSNAIKFTSRGEVRVDVAPSSDASYAIEIKVKDTGIGIPREKQQLVFEAFQQADGTTSRQFGGTGLGLTISRELATLLRGEIRIESEPEQGSTFSLLLPRSLEPSGDAAAPAESEAPRTHVPREETPPPRKAASVIGDVDDIQEGDRVVVVVEDDPAFAKLLLSQARRAGFKALVTSDGERGLALAREHAVHGVLLDLKLPDVSGFSVLERLKADPKTRHLPVHVISGMDRSHSVLKMGAVGYLTKPVDRDQLMNAFGRIESMISKEIKRVLIVEDDHAQRLAMVELLKGDDIEILAVGTGKEAIDHLEKVNVDCMILDLRLPDVSGFELLELLDKRDRASRPPVVVYTGKDLSRQELERLQRYSESIIIKGAKSPERLLDEVSLFLHRVEGRLPAETRAILKGLRGKDEVLEGRKVLLVDDDMRNIFALANALSAKGLEVAIAKDGQEAVEHLAKDPSIELALMDIMMPRMDGYEATRRIRQDLKLKSLPVIALTAKAMKDDQEKCLAAGANDYLPKPIQLDRLLSLLRVWLPQKGGL